MIYFLAGKSCDALDPRLFLGGKPRKKWCDHCRRCKKLVYFRKLFLSISQHKDFVTVTAEKIVMATNNSGLNSTYLLISGKRKKRKAESENYQAKSQRRGSPKRSVYAPSGDLFSDSRNRQSFMSSYYALAVFFHWIYSNRAAMKIRLLLLAGVFFGFLVKKCAA